LRVTACEERHYFGICAAGALDAGAGATGAGAGTAAAGAGATGAVVGIAAEPETGAVFTARSITLLPTAAVRLVDMYDKPRVALKKIAAATPVDLDMKFEEPVAPNKLPEAPEPKAAPISAPLPCCSNTKAIMAKADTTCTTTTKLNNMFIPFSV
jgi:hypothetical protein